MTSHFDRYVQIVAKIDRDLSTGRRHYRTKTRRLLTSLDDVVRAILADELMELSR